VGEKKWGGAGEGGSSLISISNGRGAEVRSRAEYGCEEHYLRTVVKNRRKKVVGLENSASEKRIERRKKFSKMRPTGAGSSEDKDP